MFRLLLVLFSLNASALQLGKQAEDYRQHFGLRDPYTKLVNYHGEGFEPLYGTRNFRVVLEGVYYRGGSNNTHNRNHIRGNNNPLQIGGLKNLCEEGFTEATYLYNTNYKSAPSSISCRTRSGGTGHLVYKQINALLGNHEHELLKNIYSHIKGTTPGLIYDHCWNGWHASGYVAAISLIQFCHLSHADADRYWVKNTDGNFSNHSSIRKKIAGFKPFHDIEISEAERKSICSPAERVR